MRSKLFCAVLLSAAAMQAQPTPQPSTDKPATVSGVVTNSLTGAPILRAHVSLYSMTGGPQQRYGAMTNGEGKFSITQLPPGRYSMNADRVGFVMPPNRGGSYSNVNVAPGENRSDLKLSLTPTGAISGRVLDAEGQPMQGVEVGAEGSNGNGDSSTTDDRGQYRIGGLAPGKYRALAHVQTLPFPPEVHTDGTKDVHYAPTYYPDSLAAKTAARLEVASGAEISNMDIRLVRTPIVTVSGVVSGLPPGAKNVNIQVGQRSGNGYGTQGGNQAKPDGKFEVWRLDPGKYTLTAMTGGYNGIPRLQSAPVDIDVADMNIDHLELRMVPPFDLTGQLRFDDEAARQPAPPPTRPGQQQQTPPRPQPRTIRLSPANGMGMMGDANTNVPIAADDTFTMEKVQPGKYHLNLSWQPAYVRSVRVGDQETDGDVLDVRNGARGPITVRLSSLTGAISGTVTDFKGPLAQARIALVSDPPDGSQFPRMYTSDTNGVYNMPNVQPGKYKLIVLDEDANMGQFRSERGLEDFDGVAISIELHAGDKLTQDLKAK